MFSIVTPFSTAHTRYLYFNLLETIGKVPPKPWKGLSETNQMHGKLLRNKSPHISTGTYPGTYPDFS